jgi:cobalt-zinc-cadmium efflux system membrane fusion protein
MKKHILSLTIIILALFIFTACSFKTADEPVSQDDETQLSEKDQGGEGQHEEEGMRTVHLSELKFNHLEIKLDTLSTRVLSGVVEANGQLEVPPQHEATVTAVLGANVASIKMIEGDRVRKGQVIAYLTHPTFTQLQTDYIKAYQQLHFLEKEYHRQKRSERAPGSA